MSEPEDTTAASGGTAPSGDGKKARKPAEPVTKNRIIIWVLAGGFGLYMIGTGLVGLLTK